ncbi:hypothetical protein [Actinoallomurus sp. CA-150999]|uniref:hypothetical protein n=1 Tax=Actinoallomurus sp. CA-150999 TaxID=3239887 RepID=UPI003D8DF941
MSDQGSAGQWRPASSHSGPYSEQDEPTGPLPAVSGQDAAPSGFPPVSGQPGSWSADDDAPTGGFPSVSTPPEPQETGRRERAPFEPADPRRESAAGPSASAEPGEPNGFGPSSGSGGFDPSPETGWSGGFGSFNEPPAGESAAGASEQGPSFPAGNSFGAETHADPEPYAEPTTAFESVTPPEEETPSSSFGRPSTTEFSSDAAGPAPSGSTPPFGSEAPHVDPYDARDASYGYEVSDPSFASAPSHPGRETVAGFPETASPGVDSGPQPFSFESLLAPGEGTPGAVAPNGQAAYDGASAPQSFRAPGETFAGEPAAPPPPADRRVSAEDQEAENDFFAQDGHPPMWDKVVAPSGPPPQPGKPSSGNLRLPDWMRDEANAGGGEGLTAPPPGDDFEEEGRTKRRLFAGLGVLVVGVVAATGAYFIKARGGSDANAHSAVPSHPAKTSPKKGGQAANPEPEKPLAQFKGDHTKPLGHITDPRAGLSYPKLGKPWQMQTQKSAMAELGFSAGQFAVTEKAGNQPKRWGRLLSAQLGGADKNAYDGPGTEQTAAAHVADTYEARMYGYKHKKKELASQPLDIDGHKGWLVGYYLTFHRPGVKATGEIFTVALVDTGKKTPGVVLMTVPNTDKKLWPDVNYVMRSIKVV